ncbi:apolipoprotein N-acyltransferase [Naasia sp. SYSU D00057]|uniref:apolipoprotein N-acyltransferase n=1 Tax=Naasia sp. SYSU D00057 TaxID=2817380 RepID=UPI0027DB6D30|nr:apolipoprotein N-acyltransferase [Naasia sp. SYSU D00057]
MSADLRVAAVPAPKARARGPARAPSPPLPLWGALLSALAGGVVLDGAFPDRGIWPLAFVAIGIVLVALRGRRPRAAFLVGLVFGLTFYLVHIEWATLFLGEVPWLALSTLEALFVAGGCALIALAYARVPRLWRGRLGRIGLLPVVVAGLWTAREAISAVWPYGGFSWGRVAMSQSDSPLSSLFSWLGISGVSFVMVWLTALALELWFTRPRNTLPGVPTIGAVPRLVLATAAVAAVLAVPAFPTVAAGSLRVGAVQGDTPSGYFDQRDYDGVVLDGHITASVPIIRDDLDVLLWPEGASDLNPLESERAAEAFDLVSGAAQAPLIAGTITERDGRFYNSSLLWRSGEGAVDLYDKRHPVPFGEYIPDRAFWRPFAPDLIDLVQREYTPGSTDAVFDLGDAVAGIDICFDIVDDALITESVRDGAQVLFAQTNNADFGRTDESVQQLAIARIRALETGRSVVSISTVSASAVIGPDGAVLEELPAFEPAALVEDVPLRDGLTPAVVAGRGIEVLVSGFGLAALLLTLRRRR